MEMIQEGTTEFEIKFKYRRYKHDNQPYEVECQLFITDPRGEYVEYGYANCHANDQFRKEIGRKLALQRALGWITGDNSTVVPFRTLVWETYHSREFAGGMNVM